MPTVKELELLSLLPSVAEAHHTCVYAHKNCPFLGEGFRTCRALCVRPDQCNSLTKIFITATPNLLLKATFPQIIQQNFLYKQVRGESLPKLMGEKV